MAATCCRFLVGVVRRVPSPFARLVATGYYDGPTEGLVECGTCGTTYSFHKLDWDDQQDLRVFSLAPLAPLASQGLEDLANASGAPPAKWPSWVLADETSAGLAAKVDELRGSAFPEEFVVATEDLLREIDVWRPVGLGPHGDWFSELALDRGGSSARATSSTRAAPPSTTR